MCEHAIGAFLLTPLREGRLHGLCDLAHVPLISTHAPAGGATASRSARAISALFLLTPLREGRRKPPLRTRKRSAYFYSRPCGRGDADTIFAFIFNFKISTHAPAGGATAARRQAFFLVSVFLLTPLREGRLEALVGRLVCAKFLLTPLREGRRLPLELFRRLAVISTHAPAGGATWAWLYASPCSRDFYSRPCGRGDASGASGSGIQWVFLLTPLREGRPGPEVYAVATKRISTHAPAGGATLSPQQRRSASILFLLTPLREGRPASGPGASASNHFYSRPCGRGDPGSSTPRAARPNFYSRPCGRGDRRGLCRKWRASHISTHAPAGGATGKNRCGLRQRQISTHAPAGGATRRGRGAGGDICISTHAPAGGATAASAVAEIRASFLLTPLREGRPAAPA